MSTESWKNKKVFSNRYLYKQLGQVVSPKSQFWPKAAEVYLVSGREALMMQRCLLAFRDVLFVRKNIQALSGPSHVTTQYFCPQHLPGTSETLTLIIHITLSSSSAVQHTVLLLDDWDTSSRQNPSIASTLQK